MPVWSPHSLAVTQDNLSVVLAQYNVVVIHAWATWNQHDRDMDALIQRLEPCYTGRIFFCSIDIDNAGDIPLLTWGFMNIPALVCFIKGQRHETVIGLLSEAKLSEKLQAWVTETQL